MTLSIDYRYFIEDDKNDTHGTELNFVSTASGHRRNFHTSKCEEISCMIFALRKPKIMMVSLIEECNIQDHIKLKYFDWWGKMLHKLLT